MPIGLIGMSFWGDNAEFAKAPRRLRERNPNPLILCGHGVSMRVEGGALLIRDGFTHYPQSRREYRLFKGDMDLPPRILLLDGSGSLTFDVLSWLAEQGIQLARVKMTGEVATVASGTGYAADPAKICWQRETRSDESKRLRFAADTIGAKLVASLSALNEYVPPSSTRDLAIAKAERGIERLASEAHSDMNAVFAIEGECASAYFAAWHGIPINWTGLAKRPVPDSWHCYSGRSSLATGVKPENRNASHPINAMLNYAYAVKLAQLQIDAIGDGYDPTAGIMHNGKRGSPALILDFIEPHRPVVDALVLRLVAEQRFSAADFIIRRDGVCRLSPQMARMIASLVSGSEPAKSARQLPGRKPPKRSRAKRLSSAP